MFNWFRRKFGDRQETETEQVQPETTTPETPVQEPEPEPEPVEAKEDTTQEDYLKWAKSAYQNIKQRKVEEQTQVEEQEVKSTQPEPEETATETVAEIPTPVIETQEVEPEETVVEEPTVVEEEPTLVEEPTVVEEKPTLVEEKPVLAEEATVVEEKPAVAEEKPTIAQPAVVESEAVESAQVETMPAWMQKSDRLEALKETAIETPTPETETPAEDLEFDEEFVWSAQVLAKQGRRPEDISEAEINWLKKLRQGLGKTRRSLVNQLKAVVGQGPLNEDAVMAIEALLLQADVGIEATDRIIETLQAKLREEALPSEQAIEYLKTILCNLLDRPLEGMENTEFVPEKDTLNVWLLTGVNGAGKTTTIGKLAHMAQQSGYHCVIAAADTFRAAAVEQVKVWGERSGTQVIANPGKNTDPAAVVYDGISAAQSRNLDLLLVDTAGRLQNKKNLMAELAKIRRIIDKKAPNAKVESLLVLDATLGQNGLRQAEVFSEAAKLSGVVLTKLDGTAKGGVALAVAEQLNLPIRFIGAGEGIEDLRPFSSYEFVEALLNG